jgi:3D (Asp-Asp-Asp) domain-containing protein
MNLKDQRTERIVAGVVLGLAVAVLSVVLVKSLRLRPPLFRGSTQVMLKTTAYCPCKICCGWRRDGLGRPMGGKRVGETTLRRLARKGTLATDLTRFPPGTVMQIDGYGYGRVEDTLSDAQPDHVDLFFTSHRRAREWGTRELLVRVWLAERVDP